MTFDAERRPTSETLTRKGALARLEAFVPRAGRAYGRNRNLELGEGCHEHVSRLSPALRRRLVSEEEVVAAVLGAHGFGAAEKFISEVFWRSYWKGWLEARPVVWARYLDGLSEAREELEADGALAARYRAAADGQTGIDCFDSWCDELRRTGYLHNWARMQFASIWVFTLGLRWELGAELMRGALADGDPASNTLSWRWVVGLHTEGKSYLASAERIKAMTGGRFDPKGLAQVARIPQEKRGWPEAAPVRCHEPPRRGMKTLLLLTPDDLSLEHEAELGALEICGLAGYAAQDAWDAAALADGLNRAGAAWGLDGEIMTADEIIALAQTAGAEQIITPYAPVGPVRQALENVREKLQLAGLSLAEYQRDWDRRTWPHCTMGFFALKKKIPQLLSEAGLL